jgi:hypothetical protein
MNISFAIERNTIDPIAERAFVAPPKQRGRGPFLARRVRRRQPRDLSIFSQQKMVATCSSGNRKIRYAIENQKYHGNLSEI